MLLLIMNDYDCLPLVWYSENGPQKMKVRIWVMPAMLGYNLIYIVRMALI